MCVSGGRGTAGAAVMGAIWLHLCFLAPPAVVSTAASAAPCLCIGSTHGLPACLPYCLPARVPASPASHCPPYLVIVAGMGALSGAAMAAQAVAALKGGQAAGSSAGGYVQP